MADTPKTPETAADSKPATKRRAAKMLQNIERDQAAQEKPQQPQAEAPEKNTTSSRKRSAKPAVKPRKQAAPAASSTQPANEQPANEQPPAGAEEAVQPAAVRRKPITAHLPEGEYQQFEQMIAEAAMQGVVRVSGVMMVRAAFQAFKDMDPKKRAAYLKGLDVPKPGRPFSKEGKS